MALTPVLKALGTCEEALLGQGGEALVFALDEGRIARVSRPGTSRVAVEGRKNLLAELGQSADKVPFHIPMVLDTLVIEDSLVTIEKRLPGRPMSEELATLTGEARDALIRNYLETAAKIGDLALNRPWYGELLGTKPIRTHSFQAYLEKRAWQSLQTGGQEFAAVDSAKLAMALPEPSRAAFVHLDAFPGNMLAEGENITAVIDFGVAAIIGDRRLDPLTAAVYLTPAITPGATNRDRSAAQEWLVVNGLADLYPPVQNWIAAYWSFAKDDLDLYQWCETILIR